MSIKFAHTKEGTLPDEWQELDVHCENVARLAALFARGFGCEAWGRALGELHDAGKSRQSFQHYLKKANDVDDASYDSSEHSHSGVGACWADMHLAGGAGQVLAYCIAGHHAGLPDWSGGETPNGALRNRLQEERDVLDENNVREWITTHEREWKAVQLTTPWKFSRSCPSGCFYGSDFSFWIRMLYSCLVDADFLDTEAFMDHTRSDMRSQWPALIQLSEAFFAKLSELEGGSAVSPVNGVRAKIRCACEDAAEHKPGLFSLTVPTGGGKTLSAMAFAFRHALKYGKKRIIYVIPYTSIIEQTADALRSFLGEEAVVEHHSNFDPEKETQRSRLASENWDAPVVVTTSVQFFESLYSCKSSRSRKIHNIAESVVLMDEVQLLPTHLLLPCVEAIRQLSEHYGTTIVLSTATQPALPGLAPERVSEIIPKELELYRNLKRTEIRFPDDLHARETWASVAAALCRHKQVLCVVNTRRDCRELFDLMPAGTIHLSALMCGEHRSRVIASIKKRLHDGEEIRVVSTQLVEAGVDVDFPIVYRAFTGLSSIVQTAGRCNREGRHADPGQVVVFMPPKCSPRGELRKAEQAMIDLLATDGTVDCDDPCIYPKYFERLYGRMNDLGTSFKSQLVDGASDLQFQFREAAADFQMIDDAASESVIVRYGDNQKVIAALEVVGPKRIIMRRLQRYTVRVPRASVGGLLEKGLIEELGEGSRLYVQTKSSLYDPDFGLDLHHAGVSVEDLIV